MGKIHTRAKRRAGGPSHLGNTRPATRARKPRPRSFSSEEIAEKWAKSKGIEKYTLKNLSIGENQKKIVVIPQ